MLFLDFQIMWIDDDGHICGNDNEGKNDNGNNDGYENEVNKDKDDNDITITMLMMILRTLMTFMTNKSCANWW